MKSGEAERTDAIVEWFDGLFLAGNFEEGRALLRQIDPRKIDPKTTSAILMVTRAAKVELAEERVDFVERARAALSATWRLSPEAVDSILRRNA